MLLVCWTIVLAAWLRGQLTAQLTAMGSPVVEAVTADPAGQVVVGAAALLAGGPAVAPGAAPEEARAFYYEQLPGQLCTDAPA